MNVNSLIGMHQIQALEQLSVLAGRLACELRAGDTILLSGNLGAGKTTFTQFLGKALGVEGRITSPTYTLVGEYPITGNSEVTTLVHMDLYRMGEQAIVRPLALNDTYIREILEAGKNDKAVVIIEWSELLRVVPTGRCWHISLKLGAGFGDRIVNISYE